MILEQYRGNPTQPNWGDRLANAATAVAVILVAVPAVVDGEITGLALGGIAAALVSARVCSIKECKYADRYREWLTGRKAEFRGILGFVSRCHAEEVHGLKEELAAAEAELAKFKRGMKHRDPKTGQFVPGAETGE